MGNIWKGPGVLWGMGNRPPVHPGKPIPKGHVTDERLKQLGDRVVNDRAEARKAAEKAAAKEKAEFDAELEKERQEDAEREAAEKAADEKEAAELEAAEKEPADETPKRGPGRPPGSKNK